MECTMINKISGFLHYINNQRITREEMVKLQSNKLQKIIGHAYRTTPFYHKWMDQYGVRPDQIKCAEDLVRIPPVSKSDVQMNYTSCISDVYNIEDCLIRTTSGSSGKMLRVIWDKENFLARLFIFYRTISLIGYGPFKKLLYFLPVTEKCGFTFGLFRHMGLGLDKSFEEVRDMLILYKPDILSIYPSYALDLGKQLTNIEIKLMNINAISLNSEMISPWDVIAIEEIFKCPVYQEYSTVELGMIASMCREKGMHVFNDNVVLEILDNEGNPSKPGDRGEVVITALNSFAMPFIRYKIGDFSRILEGSCSCGMEFPLIGQIEGRKDDSFKLNDGSLIPAWKIYEIVERPMEEFGMNKLVLTDFYLVQKKYDLAEFYYVKGPDFKESYINELQSNSECLFGKNFTLNVIDLDSIDRVKVIKRKYIHNDLPQIS